MIINSFSHIPRAGGRVGSQLSAAACAIQCCENMGISGVSAPENARCSDDGIALVTGLPRLDLAATEGKGAGRGGRATVRHLRVILCVSVWRARAHVHRCTSHTLTHAFSHIRVCVCV